MIQPTLRIAPLQANLVWNDIEANFRNFERQIEDLNPEVDLYVLPEMFSTGFCMDPSTVDPKAGELSLEWLKAQARIRQTGFCGSVLYRLQEDKYVNRMFLVERDGSVVHYDKWHRFSLAGEDKAYAIGNPQPVIAEFRGWKLLLQVCYDLRFPVYSRNKPDGYDVLIYVANWPSTRSHHWRTLLTARAIENQAFCIGVNRLGKDNNGLNYQGDSLVVDPLGTLLLDLEDELEPRVVEIAHHKLLDVRKRLPFLVDTDKYRLHD